MKSLPVLALATGVALIGAGTLAQEAAAPQRWANPMAGASNLMNEAKAIEAVWLIRYGRVVSIGRPYVTGTGGDDAKGGATAATGASVTEYDATRLRERLGAAIGQSGTRLDASGHFGAAGPDSRAFYGLPLDKTVGPGGLKALGIEQARPFFTRGIMLDMVSVRGRSLRAGEEITVTDIETALDWQAVDPPGPGDAVIFHTGWGQHWTDDQTYSAGAPGIGTAAADWLIGRGVALVGADTWSVEVQANGEQPAAQPVHAAMIGEHGIFLHENLATEKLIDAEISEFAFIFAPLPIVGATASPGAPLAVY